MKLLVVGGAGYVGTILRPALEAQYECHYFDRTPVPGAEDRTIVADVNDQAQVTRAVQGVDAVVFLAMGGSSAFRYKTISDVDMAFNVNVKSVYRFLHASLSAGARQFIYASTLSVYVDIFDHPPLTEDRPADCWDVYGLTKRLAENLCQAASQRFPDASIICLRLIQPKNETDWADPQRLTAQHHASHTGPQDTRDLFLAALACKTPGTHILNTSGEVDTRVIANDRVTQMLGWKPQGR